MLGKNGKNAGKITWNTERVAVVLVKSFIAMFPFYRFKPYQLMSPAEFLQFVASAANRKIIKKVRIIPPHPDTGMGQIYVELTHGTEEFPLRPWLENI